jgi:hypothetical protein
LNRFIENIGVIGIELLFYDALRPISDALKPGSDALSAISDALNSVSDGLTFADDDLSLKKHSTGLTDSTSLLRHPALELRP